MALSRLVYMDGSVRRLGSEKRSWTMGAERLKTVGVGSVSVFRARTADMMSSACHLSTAAKKFFLVSVGRWPRYLR
jgi:hypothetical protein